MTTRTLFSFYRFFSPCTTFRNVLRWSTHLRYDSYSGPFQAWRSTFHELPGLSVWLYTLWTIYYRLYGIKYKYRVVAVLYPSLVFVYFSTITKSPSHLLSSLSFALSSKPQTIVPLIPCFHSTTVLLTSSSPELSSSWQTPPLPDPSQSYSLQRP